LELGHVSSLHKTISGPEKSISGSTSQPMVTKSEKLKEALGLAGPTTAAVVPPGCKSVYQIVSDSPDFTYLKNAIDATGLKSLLDNPALMLPSLLLMTPDSPKLW